MPTDDQKKQFKAVVIIVCLALVVIAARDLFHAFKTPEITREHAQIMFEDMGGPKGMSPVIVFDASWCTACKAVKHLLSELNVTFVSADVERDYKGHEYYLHLTKGESLGIPQTVIGDSVVTGYQPWNIVDKLRALPEYRNIQP